MEMNEARQLGRAKNAMLGYFEHHLSIPKIYIDADWDGHPIDVLAINRDGVGDVHAALLFTRRYFPDGVLNIVQEQDDMVVLLDKFSLLPAQYKYIVAVDVKDGQACPQNTPAPKILEKFSSLDGIGRVGLISVGLSPDGDPEVHIVFKPERFRAKIAKLADEYVQQHEADWEIRA